MRFQVSGYCFTFYHSSEGIGVKNNPQVFEFRDDSKDWLLKSINCMYIQPIFLPQILKYSIPFFCKLYVLHQVPLYQGSWHLMVWKLSQPISLSATYSLITELENHGTVLSTYWFLKTALYYNVKGASLCAITFPSSGRFWMQHPVPFWGL